ncbi:hypothetical protein Sjap_009194 [Stephania japonica]|uniref:Uncharacterized protein n=1 Tax=Stephania japonica TaxID=461633 RepID=A0AAP0JT86_9MAGN
MQKGKLCEKPYFVSTIIRSILFFTWMAVPTRALDANDVYHQRMYEPKNEEQTNLAPLQQEWIDAFSDTHPLLRPDRDI